jgi:hypothetical protein
MMNAGDVVFEADGSMTIRGALFVEPEALALELGVAAEDALRQALSQAKPGRSGGA